MAEDWTDNPFAIAFGIGQQGRRRRMQNEASLEAAEISAGPGHANVALQRDALARQQRLMEAASETWQSIVAQETGQGMDQQMGAPPTTDPAAMQRALRRFVATPQFIQLGSTGTSLSSAMQSILAAPAGRPGFTLQSGQRRFEYGADGVPRRVADGPPAATDDTAQEISPEMLQGLSEAQQREIRLSFQAGNPHHTAQLIGRMRRENSQAIAGIDGTLRMGSTLLGDPTVPQGQPGAQGEIARALALVDRAGPGATRLGTIPGTPQYQLAQRLATIRANLGFAQLLEIKRSGAGLGALDRAELEALQTTMGSLDISQSPAELRTNLERIQRIWESARSSLRQDRASFDFQDVSRVPAQRLDTEITQIAEAAQIPSERLRVGTGPALERLGAELLRAVGGASTPQGRRVLEWIRRQEARIDRGF